LHIHLNSPPKSFLLRFVLETLSPFLIFPNFFVSLLLFGEGERRRRKEKKKGRVGFVLHLSLKEECPIKVVMDKLTNIFDRHLVHYQYYALLDELGIVILATKREDSTVLNHKQHYYSLGLPKKEPRK
jgi:hypothetical protein